MMRAMRKAAIVGLQVGAMLLLAACGGGDATQAPVNPPAPGGITYTPGVYPAASTFAAQCQTPRTGTDPATGRAFVDRAGSTTAENHWLRSWTQNLYLWYREVPDINPATVATASAYFDQMRTSATLASGQAKDRFHFTYNTAQYYQLSQAGVSLGYGIFWSIQQGTPPRRIMVQFVEPGSPAATAGITRGAELLRTDGVDVVNDATNAGVTAINDAISPDTTGESHQFVFRDRTAVNRTVTLTASAVTGNPVPITKVFTTGTDKLGYLLFNDHSAPAEAALVTAVNTLKTAGIQDLVLDLRYNGGGYLAIASELAYMIAGSTATAGRTFERIQFNDKHTIDNPVTGQALAPTLFYNQTRGFSGASGQALPTLNLTRVFVLTSADTCSASESVINGLRGIGITVYQFGPDTCGKPYGFYPQDNCGTTYFSIQFKGVNDAGFGDYVEGFSVTRVNGEPAAKLQGCPATDDLTRDLGDANEERLRVARAYRDTGLCTGTLQLQQAQAASVGGLAIDQPAKEPWRTNRILR
jgi:C-terminal processing protease CtpA/Prc